MYFGACVCLVSQSFPLVLFCFSAYPVWILSKTSLLQHSVGTSLHIVWETLVNLGVWATPEMVFMGESSGSQALPATHQNFWSQSPNIKPSCTPSATVPARITPWPESASLGASGGHEHLLPFPRRRLCYLSSHPAPSVMLLLALIFRITPLSDWFPLNGSCCWKDIPLICLFSSNPQPVLQFTSKDSENFMFAKYYHSFLFSPHADLLSLRPVWQRQSTCVLSWVWLCDHMDCSPPGSSVHGIFQARILEWVAISFSKGSSQPRDRARIFCDSCIGRPILYHCCTWAKSPSLGLFSLLLSIWHHWLLSFWTLLT